MTRRLEALLPAAAFALALLLGIAMSMALGPAFEELPAQRAIEQCQPIVQAVASDGPAALTAPAARAAYASFEAPGSLLALLGAWSRLSIGRLGVLDPLSAARLPFIALGSLGVAALAAIVRSSRGAFAGALAAAALLAMPPWLHALAVMRDGALVASLWLIVLFAYSRSIGRSRRRACWAIAGALLVGAGAALSPATLWVLLLIAIHFAITHGALCRRWLRRGRIPAPAVLLYSIVLAPLGMLAGNPALWGSNSAAVIRTALAPLAPSISPTPYAGRVVTALPVPGGYAASWLVQTLPFALALCALLGLGMVVHHALARRFASGGLRPRRDPQGLGPLLALALALSLIGPAFAPEPLTRFPPRVELALPFVAALAAIGLAPILAAHRPVIGRALAAALLSLTALLALRSPATSSAAFEPLFGGVARVSRSGALPSVDGSELGVLARALDRTRGERVAVHAPEVPSELWDALRRGGRLHTRVVPLAARAPGALVLARGSVDGEVVASVERGRTRLWTLARVR